MPNAFTGNGGTIVFGTTGFTAKYRVLSEVEQERPKLNESALDTVDVEEYIPGFDKTGHSRNQLSHGRGARRRNAEGETTWSHTVRANPVVLQPATGSRVRQW